MPVQGSQRAQPNVLPRLEGRDHSQVIGRAFERHKPSSHSRLGFLHDGAIVATGILFVFIGWAAWREAWGAAVVGTVLLGVLVSWLLYGRYLLSLLRARYTGADSIKLLLTGILAALGVLVLVVLLRFGPDIYNSFFPPDPAEIYKQQILDETRRISDETDCRLRPGNFEACVRRKAHERRLREIFGDDN
jgi:hypothetical protein